MALPYAKAVLYIAPYGYLVLAEDSGPPMRVHFILPIWTKVFG
jgi:hypothetical protein